MCARACVRTPGASREQRVRVSVWVLRGLPHCGCPVGELAGCVQGSGVRGWWWEWGVGAAGGEPWPSRGGVQHRESVCPQKTARGPSVGPAATMGKLRQGASCPCLAWRAVPTVHTGACARGCAESTAVGRVLWVLCGCVAVGGWVLMRTLVSGWAGVGVLCAGVHRAGLGWVCGCMWVCSHARTDVQLCVGASVWLCRCTVVRGGC